MAFFALTYQYTDDAELVTTHRPDHRQYLSSLFERGELLAAGPLGEPGPPGGLLIVDVESAEHVRRLAEADPFSAQGVIVDVGIASWTLSFGADRFTAPPR
jgi:uncharacterized protein YciI